MPQIFLYEEARNRFAILDGQQRLMSIYFFRKKRFPKMDRRAELREMFAAKGVLTMLNSIYNLETLVRGCAPLAMC